MKVQRTGSVRHRHRARVSPGYFFIHFMRPHDFRGREARGTRGQDALATRRRRGAAFIVTLWLVVAMTAVALAVASGARTRQYQAASIHATVQARWVELGALQTVLAALADTDGKMPEETDLPCDGAILGEGAFWIIRPGETDDEHGYGLIDEGERST